MLATAAKYALFIYITGAAGTNAPAIDTHLTFKTLEACVIAKQSMDATLQQNNVGGFTSCILLN
jgi:hypothetical protein